MRPHVNAYGAQETVLHATHKPLTASCCSVSAYLTPNTPAFHQQQLNVPKWSAANRNCYHGPATNKVQQHGKLPLHYQPAQSYQLLPVINQQHHQALAPPPSASHQQHAHLQRLHHFHHGNNGAGGFLPHATVLQKPPTQHLTEVMTHNYAKLPAYAVNQQRINECAGIPLISNASTHVAPTQRQRVMRKSVQSTPPPPPSQQQQQQATYTWGIPPNPAYMQTVNANNNIQHAMPLLQNNNNNNNNNNHINNNHKNWNNAATHYELPRFPIHATYAGYNTTAIYTNTGIQTNAKLEKSRLLRYQNSAPAALNPQHQCLATTTTTTTTTTTSSSSPTTTATTTTTCSETSVQLTNLGDTCLPRIIKPRKRRKKDRKPSNLLKFEMPEKTQGSDHLDYFMKTHKSNEDLQKISSGARNASDFLSSTHNGQSTEGATYRWSVESANLRSIWDYPLRRSFSDSSTAATNIKFRSTLSSSSESSSSSSSSSDSSSSVSSYSSTSSSTDDSFCSADLFSPLSSAQSRADIVGVIGSNRANLLNFSGDNIPRKPLLSASLSDSNDSGYGDILTGINIVNDLFGCATKPDDSFALLSGLSQKTNQSFDADNAASLLLLPETAETLLNESINEISRKLIETCGNELHDFTATIAELPHSAASLGCFSTNSEFSNDSSGIEHTNAQLIFNFENLNMNDDFPCATAASSVQNFNKNSINNKIIDENNNNNYNKMALTSQPQQQQENNLPNCFDILWPSEK